MKDRKTGDRKAVLAKLIFLFLLALPVSAATAYGEARLKATPDHVDFGTVDEGTPAITTVTLENGGDSNVAITNIRTN